MESESEIVPLSARACAHADRDVDRKCGDRQHDEREQRHRDAKQQLQRDALGIDENVVAFDQYVKGHQRQHRRQRKRIAGPHVERGAVTRTDDALAFELALIERSAVVRANVLDRVDIPVNVTE